MNRAKYPRHLPFLMATLSVPVPATRVVHADRWSSDHFLREVVSESNLIHMKGAGR